MKHLLVAASLALAVVLSAPAPVAAEELAANSIPAMRMWGTGFIVDRVGHLLTADHVTRDCGQVTAFRNGVRSAAVVVARNRDDDLSLLKSAEPLGAPVAFAGTAKMAGPLVLVASYPDLATVADDGGGSANSGSTIGGSGGGRLIGGGSGRTLFNGMIMSPPRGSAPRRLYLVSDAQPGSSGSPVVDVGGFVTGVVTAKVNWREAAARPGGVSELRMATSAAAAKEFLRGNAIDFLDEDGPTPARPSNPGHRLTGSEVRIECRG